ncbi:hypothetical protein RvY_09521 [Ramazzottius varieornatus]|uniref:Ribonuclease n=1 Tax=Ramazzottius varieornatus TaxID=947166 RepID=A0A1D1V9M8_RAMVA|nr:hypothetical protein RvY_09521 [Ramazzottius varieornatus]
MDLKHFHLNNGENFVLKSVTPSRVERQQVIMGIDEAGRGPVLGPMVYGACYVASQDQSLLSSLKVADSKTLNEEQRDACFEKIQESADTFGWIAQILSPSRISRSMLSRCKYNLNAISHDSAMFLIQSVRDMGVKISAVFVDTVGDPDKYQAKLKERFPTIPMITVSKKADSLFPVVSAASVVAKVCRDQALKEWRFKEGSRFPAEVAYGSGYPGDPATKRFLEDYCDPVFGYPQLIRFSWATTTKALESAVAVKWEEVLVEDESGTPAITQFFKRQISSLTGPAKEDKRHRYFAERNISSVSCF